MRILVTGHRGYIGSVLVDRIKAAGHEVVGVDTELYEDCTFGGNKDREIATINRDIRELSSSDLEGIDAIAHLAGVCNDPLGDLLPETTLRSITPPRCGWRRSPRPRVFADLSSHLRAAYTALPDKNGLTNNRTQIQLPLTGFPNGKPNLI